MTKKNYIRTLSGIDALQGLDGDTRDLIRQNSSTIESVLKRAKQRSSFKGFGKAANDGNQLIPAEEFLTDARYNANINEDEIKAWVYYKRSTGVPMKGWEKYFINGKQETTMLVAAPSNGKSLAVYDEHRAIIGVVPSGSTLGTYYKEEDFGRGVGYYFYDKNGNIKLVAASEVKKVKGNATSTTELNRLVKNGVLFYSDGRLLPYPVFTYGNNYLIENQLNRDKDTIVQLYGEDVFEKHLQAVKDNRPQMISFFDPILTNRPQISPISVYAHNFVISGIEGYDSDKIWKQHNSVTDEDEITLYRAFEWWLNENRSNIELFEKSVGSYEIIKYYLRGDNFPRGMAESVKSEIKKQTREEAERLFVVFLDKYLPFRDKQRLDIDWNTKFNAYPALHYDKIPIAFDCNNHFKSGDFELRPAQREGVAFMELANSGCISFDVGVGKTITAISEIAMALKTGKCKRPIIAVPNSTYRNWISELFGTADSPGVLFGTGVKINEWYNLGSGIKASEDMVEDNSITLVTYQGFKKIGFSDNVGNDLVNEFKHILFQDFETLKPKTAAKAEQRIQECIGIGNKNTVIEFDRCGFDYICFDEAHNAKNVFCSVTTQGSQKKFNQQSGTVPAALAVKLFLLANYTQKRYGGNIMLLTATPFTNSPLEIFSMLSHIGYEDLKRYGYNNIETFCETFINEQIESVVNAAGDIVDAYVVKDFRNRIVLQQLIYNHFNYKTGEEAGVKRPAKINMPMLYSEGKRLTPSNQILTYLKMTDEQMKYQESITEQIQKGLYEAHDKEDLKELLRGMSASLNNAFSPYLYTRAIPYSCEEFVERSPKIQYTCDCIKSVKEYHEKVLKEPMSGQVIFSNRGEQYFTYIKEYLIKHLHFKTGISVNWTKQKFDEVEIMSSTTCKDSEDKEEYMRAFNDGVIKVIIGTATIREGVNLQKRSTVLYNLYPDWNPTNIQQLEGRIWRQGNKYQYVRIVLPLMQNSMDTFVFQKIEEKTNRINDIWYRAGRENVLSVDSLDPEQVKLALVTDIDKLVRVRIREEKQSINRNIQIYERQLSELNDYKNQISNLNRYREDTVQALRQGLQNMEEHVDTIAMRPTEEQIAKLPKERQDKVRRLLDTFDKAKAFIQQPAFEDAELLRMSQKIDLIYPAYYNYAASQLSELMKKVVKIEKSVLEPRGYDRNSNIDKVIEELKAKLDELIKDKDFTENPLHYQNIYAEIELKKREMRVTGKSIKERTEEFTQTNYVMEYPFNPTLEIPNNTLPGVAKSADNELQLLELKLL